MIRMSREISERSEALTEESSCTDHSTTPTPTRSISTVTLHAQIDGGRTVERIASPPRPTPSHADDNRARSSDAPSALLRTASVRTLKVQNGRRSSQRSITTGVDGAPAQQRRPSLDRALGVGGGKVEVEDGAPGGGSPRRTVGNRTSKDNDGATEYMRRQAEKAGAVLKGVPAVERAGTAGTGMEEDAVSKRRMNAVQSAGVRESTAVQQRQKDEDGTAGKTVDLASSILSTASTGVRNIDEKAENADPSKLTPAPISPRRSQTTVRGDANTVTERTGAQPAASSTTEPLQLKDTINPPSQTPDNKETHDLLQMLQQLIATTDKTTLRNLLTTTLSPTPPPTSHYII